MSVNDASLLNKILSPISIGTFVLLGLTAGGITLYRDITTPAAQIPQQPAPVGTAPSAAVIEALRVELAELRKETNNLSVRLTALETPSRPATECPKAFLTVRSLTLKDRLFVNGKLMGSTSAKALSVCAGKLTIRVEAEGFDAYENTITLSQGEKHVIPETLKPPIPPPRADR